MSQTEQNDESLRVISDVGKLELAAKDIYDFDENKGAYDSNLEEDNIDILEERFNVEIVDSEQDPNTGFAAYALKDNSTGEIVIAYVGTQPDKDNNEDIKTDIKIGVNNLLNTWLAVEQYDQADAFYQQVKEKNKGAKISLTGHSLGGGAANTVALRNSGDNINVLTLNPAPVLNTDVMKYGEGFNLDNIRNVVNENDPLYLGVKAADFVIPGRVYRILNGEGHSYAFEKEDYDKWGNLKALKTLVSNNETGFDWTSGYEELVKSSGDIYKGIVGREPFPIEEEILDKVLREENIISVLLNFVLDVGDFNALVTKIVSEGVTAGKATIKFCTEVINEIRNTVDEAIDWIETNLTRCSEVVMEVLESVFDRAVDFLAGCIAVYLTLGEIREIATEIAASLVQDILDLFEGDFVLDTSITAIVGDHIRSNRNSLTNLFMNDSRRGIDRSLLNEVAKDIKDFSEELKELGDDVSLAVVSMVAKDEELHAVRYH